MKSLGFLPGSSYSQATGAARKGEAVTGWTGVGGFYWTPSAGMTALGALSGYQFSLATDISEKGDVVIGYCSNPGVYQGFEAFLWSPNTGIQSLGLLPGHTFSYGTALSGSGLVATGYSGGPGVATTAFRWESGLFQGLGMLRGYTQSYALGISREGDYIVGYVQGANVPSEAFIWNRLSGMKGIGALPGGRGSYLRDVAENGVRSVGFANISSGRTAILYDNTSGKTYFLKDLLLAEGISEATGWQLEEATSISDDGSTIVGIGRNPRGRWMYWQVTLP